MKLATLGKILRQAVREWSEDNAPRLGAALAFYTIFAIAPLLVICTAIAGLVLGEDAARGQLLARASELIGAEAAAVLQTMVTSASEPRVGTTATIIGVVTMVLAAIGFFSELQSSLNVIWNVEPRKDAGWLEFLRIRLLSFVMVLATALILFAMMIASTVLTAISTMFGETAFAFLGPLGNWTLTFVVMTLLFAMVYRFLPDAKIAWSDVWLGSLVTALLFSAGNYAIGIYLGQSAISSAYGAAGSLAVLLAWLYYASQVFLMGAEVTQVYAKECGSGIIPSDQAKRATPVAETPP